MQYSESFKNAFITAYTECCRSFDDEARRRDYRFDWNRFMLWDPEPPLGKPVLELTAEKMELRYWKREPFRFDGAFIQPAHRLVQDYPIPMIAVFEHEDKIGGFEEEVVKLCQIRCPLKIGITYCQPESQSQWEGQILGWVRDVLQQLEEHTKEDPESEYVFLLGAHAKPFGADWYHLTFPAASGPGTFQALRPPQ